MARRIGPGHNLQAGSTVTIAVKAFNSIARCCDPERIAGRLTYPAGTTVGDVARDLAIPTERLFLILVNGRDVSRGLVGDLRLAHEIEDGDVVAFSGPVPYSYGYGSPVV